MLAPIVLFTFNRPEHTLKTLQNLEQNKLASESILYIYLDGPKKDDKDSFKYVNKVKAIIYKDWNFKDVIIKESKVNKGLASSIIDGITDVIQKHESVIVLEDDIITSSSFLQYMNRALSFYKSHNKVWHISAYMNPIKSNYLPDYFFCNMPSCWGWGTWKNRWEKADFSLDFLRINTFSFIKTEKFPGTHFNLHRNLNINGQINTWAIRWYFNILYNEGYCLHPNSSYTNNIGMDDSGVNSDFTKKFDIWSLNKCTNFNFPLKYSENKIALKRLNIYFSNSRGFKAYLKRIIPYWVLILIWKVRIALK